ncbi:hypothetical protein HPB52_025129 [Rhipicephalus sanguineus]|uniref:Uncharacterized protein n=1 Tax=Rhipicephalus sanguineus TaxID=34632 RepID=A0A9D4TDG3_RHISA|nr:hypothetical protein HPB52_025129 [Rhipicephalus sanguineus]
MTDERGEFVEWRFWRFPPPNASHQRFGDEIAKFAAAAAIPSRAAGTATVAGKAAVACGQRDRAAAKCSTSSPRCSVFLEKRPAAGEGTQDVPQPCEKRRPRIRRSRRTTFAVAQGKCHGTESHVVGCECERHHPEEEERIESGELGSGSVYVDTVSHLAESEDGVVVAGDASTSRTAVSRERRSRRDADDSAPAVSEQRERYDRRVTGGGGLPSYRASGLRVRSHSEADSTTLLYSRATVVHESWVAATPTKRPSAATARRRAYAAPTFTLTQHRKVVLPQILSRPRARCPSGCGSGQRESGDAKPGSAQVSSAAGGGGGRRHSAYDDAPPLAGQMLLNWFCTTFPEDHYLRFLLTKQDLKLLAAQFCTHLLAAGCCAKLRTRTPRSNLSFGCVSLRQRRLLLSVRLG